MSSPFSWNAYDKQAVQQRAARQATQAQQDTAIARQRQEGARQRELITQQIVRPFLVAMARAGNPGAGRHRRWSDGGKREHRQHGRAYNPDFYFDVYVKGDWLFGQTLGKTGSRVFVYHDAWLCTPRFGDNEILALPEAGIKQFQDCLVAVLRQHNVPLPPD